MRVPINRLESIFPRSSKGNVAEADEQAAWREKAKSWEHDLENLLAEHPKIAIGAAAAFGLVLGWLVKRK